MHPMPMPSGCPCVSRASSGMSSGSASFSCRSSGQRTEQLPRLSVALKSGSSHHHVNPKRLPVDPVKSLDERINGNRGGSPGGGGLGGPPHPSGTMKAGDFTRQRRAAGMIASAIPSASALLDPMRTSSSAATFIRQASLSTAGSGFEFSVPDGTTSKTTRSTRREVVARRRLCRERMCSKLSSEAGSGPPLLVLPGGVLLVGCRLEPLHVGE